MFCHTLRNYNYKNIFSFREKEKDMADCTSCGEFTKYNGGKCSKCFMISKSENIEVATVEVDENAVNEKYRKLGEVGLTEKEKNYRYNVIKGRIAETLVQELFLSLGYNVFRYGMENTIPGIMELLRGVRSDVSKHIRSMPDFVMQNPKTDEVYFIEVKFRANGEFKAKDLPKDYPYTNAYIVHISKKHIKCITVKELHDGEEITPTSKNYLGSRKEFDLDKDVIVEFCKFAVQFFEKV